MAPSQSLWQCLYLTVGLSVVNGLAVGLTEGNPIEGSPPPHTHLSVHLFSPSFCEEGELLRATSSPSCEVLT